MKSYRRILLGLGHGLNETGSPPEATIANANALHSILSEENEGHTYRNAVYLHGGHPSTLADNYNGLCEAELTQI